MTEPIEAVVKVQNNQRDCSLLLIYAKKRWLVRLQSDPALAQSMGPNGKRYYHAVYDVAGGCWQLIERTDQKHFTASQPFHQDAGQGDQRAALAAPGGRALQPAGAAQYPLAFD